LLQKSKHIEKLSLTKARGLEKKDNMFLK